MNGHKAELYRVRAVAAVCRWSFSYTRLNLHLAAAAAVAGGCFVVDSTRNGKRFPDSFTSTVPIWCCVLNRLVASDTCAGREEGKPAVWDTALHTPRCSLCVTYCESLLLNSCWYTTLYKRNDLGIHHDSSINRSMIESAGWSVTRSFSAGDGGARAPECAR